MSLTFNDKTQFGILIVAVASLFWYIGFYSGGQKVAVLEQKLALSEFADAVKLNKLITSLRETSEALSQNISNNNLLLENTNLKSALEQAKNEIVNITKEIKTKEKMITDLGFIHESLFLRESDTRTLFGGTLIVSLRNTEYKTANLYINNKYERIGIGNYHEFIVGSKPAKLILESVTYDRVTDDNATFSILISDDEPVSSPES
jgi:regulator of replication initiation timing